MLPLLKVGRRLRRWVPPEIVRWSPRLCSDGHLLPAVFALSRRRGPANASTELAGDVDLEEVDESRDRW
jgi:hypothetical protein